MTETRITGGTITALVLIGVAIIMGIPVLITFIKARRQIREAIAKRKQEVGYCYEDTTGWTIGIWGTAVATVGIIAGVALGMIPYQARYHEWTKVHGTVTAVGNRFLGDGKSTTQNFVVTINGQPYRIDDTRAALVKAGDEVTLWCKPEWQFTGTSGEVCKWG